MISRNICIDTEPELHEIDDVIKWLKKECNKTGFGFYHNRGIIYDSYSKGQVIILKQGDESIGLVAWSDHDLYAEIDIFVIEPKYRGQGFGSVFYKNIAIHFKELGFLAAKLFCAPKESESFWKSMGLLPLPNIGTGQHNLSYYKILADMASTSYISNVDIIELWDNEPYCVGNVVPKWTWYVEVVDNLLIYPIFHPCNCNWKIRWSRNGSVIKEEKVKYFYGDYLDGYHSPFLYIDELHE